MRGLWFLAIAAVLAGSLLPGGSAPLQAITLLHVSDKVQHLLAYALLAAIPGRTESRWTAAGIGLGLIATGVLLEVVQLFIPGRSCEAMDAAADAAGVLAGLALAALLPGRGRKGAITALS